MEHRLIWMGMPYGNNKVKCLCAQWSAGAVGLTTKEVREKYEEHRRKEEGTKQLDKKEDKKMVKTGGVTMTGAAAVARTAPGLINPGTIPCPECGLENSVTRMTCSTCGTGLRKGKKEMQGQLFEANKRLKNAMKTGDTKLATSTRIVIKKLVAASNGVFAVGEDGEAVQKKSTVMKPPPREKKVKEPHNCPCCGEKTANGSFFLMGHDGRTHGILLKLVHGKMKMTEAPKGIQAMFDTFKKNPDMKMKEIAQKIAAKSA